MQFENKKQYKPTRIFLLTTFALSSIFYFLIIDHGSLNAFYVFGLMWCPGISAFITLKILKKSFKELGWEWGKTKYQIQSFIIPLISSLIIYLIVWLFGWGEFLSNESVLQTTIIGFIPSIIFFNS